MENKFYFMDAEIKVPSGRLCCKKNLKIDTFMFIGPRTEIEVPINMVQERPTIILCDSNMGVY